MSQSVLPIPTGSTVWCSRANAIPPPVRSAGTLCARSGTAACLLAALVLGPIYFTWSALAVFLALCFVTLCFGHSVGFHRRLIHRSFQCPKWLERILIYLGTVVGMGGPLWTIRTHDMRDWAQRSPNCHPFFAHKASIWRDGFWYLHCRLVLDRPPRFDPGPEFRDDRFYAFLNRSAMLAADSDRARSLRARRHAVAGAGCLRARRRLHHYALVHLAPRAHARPAVVDGRWSRHHGL